VCKRECDLESARQYMRRRRAAVSAAKAAAKLEGIAYIEPTLARVYERANGVCYICKGHCSTLGAAHKDNNRPTIDHLRPLSAGGLHSLENTGLACYRCNRQKSNNLLVEAVDDLITLEL
jgi:hypothetical protein